MWIGCQASEHIYNDMYGKRITTIMLNNSLVLEITSRYKGGVSNEVVG